MRYRKYRLRKPVCPQCGSSWRPWWFHRNGPDRFRPDCDHRFHTHAWRGDLRRSGAPMPIPDGRLTLGDRIERRNRRIQRHQEHQSKARR